MRTASASTAETARQRPRIRRLVSGGQTGADRGGLDAALLLGLDHGGWCPRGRRAEDGSIPLGYRMRETASHHYAVRTEMNVIDSDATLIIGRGALAGGSALTARLSAAHGKPWLYVDLNTSTRDQAARRVQAWLRSLAIAVLNIAGPRESQSPGIADATRALLLDVLGHDHGSSPAHP